MIHNDFKDHAAFEFFKASFRTVAASVFDLLRQSKFRRSVRLQNERVILGHQINCHLTPGCSCTFRPSYCIENGLQASSQIGQGAGLRHTPRRLFSTLRASIR